MEIVVEKRPFELRQERTVLVNTDEVTIIVSESTKIAGVVATLKKYETLTRIKWEENMSVEQRMAAGKINTCRRYTCSVEILALIMAIGWFG